MRIYLAGPMTGCPEFNLPAFHRAADRLRRRDHDVVNPADLSVEVAAGRDLGAVPREEYMRHDLAQLLTCDAIAVLPGWQQSQGASLEVAVARGCGLPVLDADTLAPAGEEGVLAEADRITAGDRQANYGPPDQDFARTGKMWAVLLGLDRPIAPRMVALMMIALKLSRETHQKKRDNAVDIAGYAKCLWMCAQAENAS